MADDFRVNDAELRFLLEDPSGPVVSDLRESTKRVARGAKRRSKGRIAEGVKAHEPKRDGRGWHGDVETAAESADGAPIGLFTEVGTKPHVIEPRDKQALAWPGGKHPVKRVNHPGTRAQPFMVPGALKAVEQGGLKATVVKSWNEAA